MSSNTQSAEKAAERKKKRPAKAAAAGAQAAQKLKKKIAALQEENAELSDKYLRLAAEYENFRKMAARDAEARVRSAQDRLIVGFLDIMDDMDRTLAVVAEEDNSDPVAEGVRLIHAHMKKFLENRGIEPIESVGMEFDVELHEALMVAEDEGYSSNVVVQEHQKGYTLNGRVIRHAKVAVNK
jgi:molecular chaperone GrpE